jgi:hypothetical protein
VSRPKGNGTGGPAHRIPPARRTTDRVLTLVVMVMAAALWYRGFRPLDFVVLVFAALMTYCAVVLAWLSWRNWGRR